jgi:hypothetical protein
MFIDKSDLMWWRILDGIQACLALIVNLCVIIEWGLLFRFFYNTKQSKKKPIIAMNPDCEE